MNPIKFQFDETKDDIKSNSPAPLPEQTSLYDGEGNVRNICFVQADGKMLFLNYAYLVSGEFLPDDGTIVLGFTTHTITLKGVKLQELFLELFVHRVRMVVCEDGRYGELGETKYRVLSISVINKN